MRYKNLPSDVPESNSKVLGTGPNGESENYSVSQLVEFIAAQTDGIIQNNTIRNFYTLISEQPGIVFAVEAFNQSNFLQVSDNELINVIVRRTEATKIDTSTDIVAYVDYYWLKSGKGTYGLDGNILISPFDLLYRRTTENLSLSIETNLPPVVYIIEGENLNVNTISQIVNQSTIQGGYLIDSNSDYFFELLEIEQTNEQPPRVSFTGVVKYYRFVGDDGNYGQGLDQSIESDFLELSQNSEESQNPTNSLISLRDVIDVNYVGKAGQALVAYEDITATPKRGARFQPILTSKDVYRGNTAIDFGVTFISGLTYNVFCNKFVLNQVDYDIKTSSNITFSNGDSANPRIDLIILRLNQNLIEATIEVIEGTPSASPIEESINLEYEIVLSRRIILANESTDIDTSVDVIYNENSEWTNVSSPSGTNLANSSDSYEGSLSILVPAISGSESIIWNKGSLNTFSVNNCLVFAIKTEVAVNFVNTKITFTYRNSVNNAYFVKYLTIYELSKFGYNSITDDWQLINIPNSFFQSSSRSNTEYDIFEISFLNSAEILLDFIQIQSDENKVPDVQFVKQVIAGSNVTVDNTDPERPIVNANSVPDSASVDLTWIYLGTSIDQDPTANSFKLNASDPSIATEIYVSVTSYPNRNVSNIISILKSGDRIYLQQRNSAEKYLNCDITGPTVDNGTYFTIPISVFDSEANFDINQFFDFMAYHVGNPSNNQNLEGITTSGTVSGGDIIMEIGNPNPFSPSLVIDDVANTISIEGTQKLTLKGGGGVGDSIFSTNKITSGAFGSGNTNNTGGWSIVWGVASGGSEENSADGQSSIAVGRNVKADGKQSQSFGQNNTSNGINSITINNGNTASNYNGFAGGGNNQSTGVNEFLIGTKINSHTNTSVSQTTPDPEDRIFGVGNGDGVGGPASTAFQILHNGKITAPSLSIASINEAGNSSLITKEYFDSTLKILEEYSDNATATAAGLPLGTQYRTGDLVKVVH